MSLRDRNGFLLIAGLVLAYVALRAALVPLTHDEARTFFVYTLSGEFLPGLSHWDAGNHPLCTALGRISFKAFGMAPLALRSANVLALLVYAWYAWRMGAWVRDALVRWCLWTALLLAPVLIEFFALYRGYGLGMAFLLMALYHTAEAVRTNGLSHVLLGLTGWMLAGGAMLSLSIAWAAGALVLLGVLLARPAPIARRVALLFAWLALGAAPLAGAFAYGSELGARGLLYYGEPDGLVSGTWRSLMEMLFGDAAGSLAFLPGLLIAGAALAAGVVFVLQRPKEFRRSVLAVVVLLLLAELFGRLVLGELKDVLYPSGRTALHWLPLLVVMVALVVDRSAQVRPALRFAALVLAVLPLRTVATINLTHTAIWPQEAVSGNIFDTAARMQRAAGRPLLIDAYNQMPPQWDFERLRHYPKLAPLASTGFPQPDCDLLLIDTTYFTAPPGFRTVATSANGRQVLKVRERPLQLALLADTTLVPATLGDEFRTLWEPDVRPLLGYELVLDLELVLRSDAECLATELVVEVGGVDGGHVHYDPLQLRYLQQAWEGDTLHLLRRIPLLAGNTKRVVCYLWDQRRQHVELAHARIRTLRIQPDHDLRNP
ncbi:MAG: hypothetical protein JNL05_14630 [Flavobacteriales bacterium]|nr:hypothetical protein [Flavobacteriales bacterium]